MKACKLLMVVVVLAARLEAQGVVIRGGAPAAVLEELKAQLLPQGFQMVSADDKSAVFNLDQGMVQQQGNRYVSGALVHIVLEFTARFKQKKDGLQVTASEELIGNPASTMQFRKPVDSQAERRSMQELLDAIRADVEARTSSRDSAARKDSIPHE